MIALYRGISAASRLIRFANWSPYSHAAWVCSDDREWIEFAKENEALGRFAGMDALQKIALRHQRATWILSGRPMWESWTQGGVTRRANLSDGHTPGTCVDLFAVRGITAAQMREVNEFFALQKGKRYDWPGILHFATRRPQGAEAQRKWFCSEIVFAALAAAGIPPLARIAQWKVYPGMLAYSPLLVGPVLKCRTWKPNEREQAAGATADGTCNEGAEADGQNAGTGSTEAKR
jgi:hypothetical protein